MRSRAVASRARTQGRFWRAIRRIDERSVDLMTVTTRLVMLSLCCLYLIGVSQ